MEVRSYAGVVGCGSALKRIAVAFDRTHASVQIKSATEIAN
jgi:hypothetical protein